MARTAALLSCSCSHRGVLGRRDPELPAEESLESTGAPDESRDLPAEQISSGTPGRGPEIPEVFAAPSASTAPWKAVEAEVLDSADGTYVSACWGLKPTGGHSLAVESAPLEGETG